MHGIVKFIQDGEEIKKTLEIGEDEVKILRFLARKFLSAEPSVPVSELLQRLFCGERGELWDEGFLNFDDADATSGAGASSRALAQTEDVRNEKLACGDAKTRSAGGSDGARCSSRRTKSAKNAPSLNDAQKCAVMEEAAGKYDYLEHLRDVRSLLELGLVAQNFTGFKSAEFNKKTPLLALLHTEIELSEHFLQILQDEKIELYLPQIAPYGDHLEYLKDQFYRVELYRKRLGGSAGIRKSLGEKIKSLEKIIAKRIKLSKISFETEEIFKSCLLNEKEQIIFLSLLREEYSGDFESFRDTNALLSLVSENEIERMANRALLEEGSNLIENNLVDYDETIASHGGIVRNFFIGEEALQNIMHPKKSKKTKKAIIENIVKQSEIFELVEPQTDIDDVVLNAQTKELLNTILKQVDKRAIARLSSWGIKSRRGVDAKIIFYGLAGTGKTMSALSLAKSLKKQVLSFDCSKILSKYVGESEQNVRKIFDVYDEICAKSKTEPVLLLNEADQFLSSRLSGGLGGSEQMHNQMQNIFLERIEKFNGVLIATTNLLQNIDTAFSRRFDYKIEFKKPGLKQRLEIWRKIVPQNASFEADFSLEALANYELSGAQIALVMKNTALKVAIRERAIFSLSDFEAEIKRELSSGFGEDKKVGFNQNFS